MFWKKKELVVGEPLLTLAEKLKDYEWFRKQKLIWVDLYPLYLSVNDNVWTEWTTSDETEYIGSVIFPLLNKHNELRKSLRLIENRKSAMLDICGGNENEEYF